MSILIGLGTAIFALGAVCGGAAVMVVAVCAPGRLPGLVEDTPVKSSSDETGAAG